MIIFGECHFAASKLQGNRKSDRAMLYAMYAIFPWRKSGISRGLSAYACFWAFARSNVEENNR